MKELVALKLNKKKLLVIIERINLTQISKRPGANRSGIRANKIKE
jgi:hypothetical protein